MTDTAHSTQSVLRQVRSSYGQGRSLIGRNKSGLSDADDLPVSSSSPSPVQPPFNAGTRTIGMSPPMGQQSEISTQEQLDVLDQVLAGIEVAAALKQQETPVEETPVEAAVPEESPIPEPILESVAQVPENVVDQPVEAVPAPVAEVSEGSDPWQAVSAAMPMAIDSATDTLNPTQPTVGTAKERLELAAQPDQAKIDVGGGIQVVEYEPSPEISPEVESYLQKVEENQDQQPQEIVIAGDAAQLLAPAPVLKPVIVLPITPDTESVGARKKPQWSIRWLVEWSRRLMRMFSGKILYAESEAN